MKILTYLALHFKLQLKKDKSVDNKSRIISFTTTILTFVVVMFLCKFLFDIIYSQLGASVSSQHISNLLLTIIEIVLVFVAISLEIKYLLKPSDLNISARFPMSSSSLFIAQILVVYVYLFLISALSIFPMMTIFGWSWGLLSGSFFAKLFLLALFSPLLPFAIATIFVVPTMYMLSVLKNHNVIKLIIFIAFLIAAFVLYNFVLNFLAEYYIHNKINSSTQNLVISFVTALSSKWNIVVYLSNIFNFNNVAVSILIVLGFTIVFLSLGLLFAKPVYSRVRKEELEGSVDIFSKQSKITSDKAHIAIFKKEFKEIMRTQTYAYFYLGIAIITPVMVLLTNKLVQKVGEAQMGGNIAFGISILVVFAFMVLINSFSANAISREGKVFYITKITPIDYRVQLISKGVLNLFVSLGALFISVIILCTMKFVTVIDAIVILVVAMLFAIGVILNGFNINVRHPYVKTTTTDNQTNSTILILLGIVVCALESIAAIVLSFFIPNIYIYLIIFTVSIVYTIINLLIFVFTTNKKYSKIE